jgi:3,5-epimerase/4-reductase
MSQSTANSFLLFGKGGWICGKVAELLKSQGKEVRIADSRMENRESVVAEIEKYRPTHIINAAGITGRPNIDWCEDNKIATLRSNVIGAMTIADICELRCIHHTLFATGCIYEYDEEHPVGGKGFLETEIPNYYGSFYSHTKAIVEELLVNYKNTLILRVRMPISDDLSPRNFITKILNYEKVVNVPNSMTVLTDLLPVSIIMSERNLVGIFNFCNRGSISHNEILEMYKEYIDPTYRYTNFTVEEQSKILKAGRSNNTLSHDKLYSALPDIAIPEIHESMRGVFSRMRANLEKDGTYPDKLPRH